MRLLKGAVAAWVASACLVALADVVDLKGGDRIEGEIVEETAELVRVKTPYGMLNIPRAEIARVTKTSDTQAELLKRKKELADRHFELAAWAKEKGLEKEMAEALEEAIKLYPDHEKAHLALGYVLKDGKWVKEEKPAGTEEPAEPRKPEAPAAKMTPEELMDAHQQAQMHLYARKHDKALEVYRKILESYPDDLTANYNAACMLALRGEKEGALKYLEHSIRKAVEMSESGTPEEKENAKSILDLVEKDTDLDSLRESEKYKEIVKLVPGQGEAPKEAPEEPPKEEGKKEEEKKEEKPREPKRQREF